MCPLLSICITSADISSHYYYAQETSLSEVSAHRLGTMVIGSAYQVSVPPPEGEKQIYLNKNRGYSEQL